MIKCNLAVLLAERGIRISDLARDTGISRTTLTYLAQNQSKGVQFDTLYKICDYLKVGIDEIISLVPLRMNLVGMKHVENEKYIINVKIIYKSSYEQFNFLIEIDEMLNSDKSERRILHRPFTVMVRTPDKLRIFLSDLPKALIETCIESQIFTPNKEDFGFNKRHNIRVDLNYDESIEPYQEEQISPPAWIAGENDEKRLDDKDTHELLKKLFEQYRDNFLKDE